MPWPTIAGVDAADARARWCGDTALYTTMLSRLFEEFHEVGLADWADTATITLYAQRLHKMRGGAHMLGAKAIAALAEQVESACLAGNRDQADQLTAKLSHEMRCLVENAQPALADAAQAVDKLAALLRQGNFAAVDYFRSLSARLRYVLGTHLYEQMRIHMDNLQFDAAFKDLRQGQMAS